MVKKGYKPIQQRKRRVSEAKKKYWKDPENRKQQSLRMKATHKNPEARRRLSLSHIGIKHPNRKRLKPFTEEHRLHLSQSIKKWWSKPENKKRMSMKIKKWWQLQQ